MMSTQKVIELVVAERQRQTAKWGKQDFSLFIWLMILQEEIGEVAKAIFEDEPKPLLINEAVQVAAVGVQILEWALEKIGWEHSSRQVLNSIFIKWELTQDSPVMALLNINMQVGTLSARLEANPTGIDNVIPIFEKITFYACLLVYRLLNQESINDSRGELKSHSI